MAYKKALRHVTDEQFSEGTTIDGTRIDSALDDVLDAHNHVAKGDMPHWLPVTYVSHWSPSRPIWRWFDNAFYGSPSRNTPNECYGAQDHWFPFVAAHNHADEVYPVAEQPSEFTNEYRHKGFFHGETNSLLTNSDKQAEDKSRTNGTTAADITYANQGLTEPQSGGHVGSILHQKHFAATFSYYFDKPVIIDTVSVFAAQEHPVSYFNSYESVGTYMDMGADGYKNNTVQANQYSYTSDPAGAASTIEDTPENPFDINPAVPLSVLAKTGNEYPGEKWTSFGKNFGNGTVEITIDNAFNLEKRALNSVVFHKYKMGSEAQRFHRFHPSNSTTGHTVAEAGNVYIDMQPEYPGGATWGVWMLEEGLNIPVPAGSRVRFSVIVTGFLATQLFEWNCALTVLEMTEE